jgi:LmbE family N-acetylglucosaminyl deacetylase
VTTSKIRCGGKILELVNDFPGLEIYWVVFSSAEQRKQEALKSADGFLCNVSTKKIAIDTLRDGFSPYIGVDLKERCEQLKSECSPDLILTHYRNHLHQDYRLVFRANLE